MWQKKLVQLPDSRIADGVVLVDPNTGDPGTPGNIITKFRDAFENYVEGVNWVSSLQSGDLMFIDGNTASSSYLVISKNPLAANGQSTLTSVSTFDMPVELSVGLSMSQRAVGQELSMELVSDETQLPTPADLAISSISQSTTTLTVNTSLAHGLTPGMRISIYGNSDSRFNYPALVVATTPSPTQFTATAGPGGTIPSVTASGGSNGFVAQRSTMGLAPNGMSQIFENTTVTNASLYVRSNAGDALPSGTITGAHGVTVGTTASVQAVNAAYAYSFQPTTEFRLLSQADRVQFLDSAVDATALTTSRILRTQVVPDSSKKYRVRFRFTNNKSLTTPTAKIVSISKSGTTTATVTTDVPHGLSVTDYVVIYGVRDQTNFANLTTATAVASVVSATQFTIALGSAVTATSYSGMVSKVQGGNTPPGYATQVIQTAQITNGDLTLVGSSAWTPIIGDLVNVYGCRDNTTGADMGLDGVYRVANVVTTTMVLTPVGGTTIPSTMASSNCGGTVIKRTDARISFARIFDYNRMRVEVLPRPDSAGSVGVNVNNTPAVTISSGTVTTVTSVTGVASVVSSNLGIPGTIADVASAALTTTTTTAALTPTFGTSYEVNIPVTAVTGTTPTLDVSIEESDDSGTNWFKVYDFPRITATGIYRSPKLPLTGNRVRYVQTVAGTSPSFTRAINRLQGSDDVQPIRQLVDRTVVLTTLNSTTPSLTTNGCRNAQLVVNVGAVTTTAPAIQLEGSDDNGASWYAIGTPLTAVASSTVQVVVNNVNSQLLRARVSTAGSGVTAGYTLVKAF